MGEGQHRGVRRRSRQRDDLRRVGRVVRGERADGVAGWRAGSSIKRDWRERRLLHGRRRHAGPPAARRSEQQGEKFAASIGRRLAGRAAREAGGRGAAGRAEDAAVVLARTSTATSCPRTSYSDLRRRQAGARAAARRLERRRGAAPASSLPSRSRRRRASPPTPEAVRRAGRRASSRSTRRRPTPRRSSRPRRSRATCSSATRPGSGSRCTTQTGRAPVYRYSFDRKIPVAPDAKVNGVAATSRDIGARHAGEIEYVFGTLDHDCRVSPGSRAIASCRTR